MLSFCLHLINEDMGTQRALSKSMQQRGSRTLNHLQIATFHVMSQLLLTRPGPRRGMRLGLRRPPWPCFVRHFPFSESVDRNLAA